MDGEAHSRAGQPERDERRDAWLASCGIRTLRIPAVDVRDELETQARSRGIGLATLLRDLATEAAREARRRRIRQASATIGAHVATSAEGQALYEEWGMLRADIG